MPTFPPRYSHPYSAIIKGLSCWWIIPFNKPSPLFLRRKPWHWWVFCCPVGSHRPRTRSNNELGKDAERTSRDVYGRGTAPPLTKQQQLGGGETSTADLRIFLYREKLSGRGFAVEKKHGFIGNTAHEKQTNKVPYTKTWAIKQLTCRRTKTKGLWDEIMFFFAIFVLRLFQFYLVHPFM